MPRLLATAAVGRLPVGMNGLSIVLFVRAQTGSFATAGAAVAAFSVVVALAGVRFGRLVDRRGPRAVFPRLVVVQAAAAAALVALGLSGASGGLLVLAAAAMGLGQPPWASVLRGLFPLLVDDAALLPTLFALDSVLVELSFTLGPLLTAGLVALLAPQAALVAAAILVTVGGLAFVASPAVARWPVGGERAHVAHPLGVLASPAIATVVAAMLPAGFAIGAIEVALPSFASDHGAAASAGALISVWSVGSALGGIAYGARAWSRPLAQVWAGLVWLLAVAMAPLLLAGSMLAMAALLLPAGAAIAPMASAGGQLLGAAAPAGMAGEAYAWGPTSIVLGAAAGSAAAGLLVDHAGGWRAAVLASIATAVAGAVVAVARRRRLVAVDLPV
ncbi:MAG TPA: MFS transporter [Solirubrobacteraceae bacterium]|nr:MFS transporter [Solirubrobacteraceae bacterium]